ncbi:cyclodeaminase/cyclohydrolase family protein [Halobellus ruber]|uniref:Cyclodeaminase/cyclohydrolase family protein n=1 Tax=Halobellus ruber TaxID=2761102 RepID=A0A7J9SH73_9EURY|nr:cyclodeaminase/cyclohydrolase family protein [Halobellus ruber]
MTYDDTPIGKFLDAVASERVVPAGGTAAAITGATGAALCEMVCVHTTAAADGPSAGGESEAGPGETSLSGLRTGLRRRRKKLLALGGQDAAVVEEVFGDGEAPSTRLRRRAAGIPLAVAEAAVAVLTDAETAHRRGTPGVAADAKTGAYLADAAVRASVETVRINAAALPNRPFASDLEGRAATVEESADPVRRRLLGGN